MTDAAPPVLIVDDHALVSTTLAIALRGQGISAHRCDVGSAAEVTRVASGLGPGIALVDIDLGTGPKGERWSGVDLVPLLRRLGWRVVMLTGGASEADVAASVAAGAIGWLHKLAPFDELLPAVLDAVAGRPVLAEAERLRLLKLHHAEQARRNAQNAGYQQLTARERDVLADLVAGRRAAAIAKDSGVSLATVRAQIRSILTKLGASSQLEAVALVREIEDH
jgi:DNA-binding NarL/FixJ family response regulator